MDRSTLSLVAALLLGNTAASAAAPSASDMPLQNRIEAARNTIDNLTGGQPDSTAKTGSDKVVQHHWDDHHWRDHHHRRRWHDWDDH